MASIQEELKMLLENPVLIYGAGRVASRMVILDLKALNANIIGIAVSDVSDSRTIGFDGFQIKTPGEYVDYADSAVVFIATSELYHDEIRENCRKLGFNNIIASSPALIELMSDASHKKLFEKHGLPLDTDIITIGNGKFLNPYSDIFSDKMGVVSQWEDICSTEFGDMSMSFEGPYEYGAVSIAPGDVVFDIGANVGYVSVYAASKGAEVYAFEPGVEHHSMIKRHSELNGNRIHLEPYAVSDKCGSAELWINDDCQAAHSLDCYIGGGRSSVTVPEITVDEFVKQKGFERVDYLHVFVMGYERQMLRGAQETLRKFAPKIVICAYEFKDDKEVLSKLILEGNPEYRIESLKGKLYAYKPENGGQNV